MVRPTSCRSTFVQLWKAEYTARVHARQALEYRQSCEGLAAKYSDPQDLAEARSNANRTMTAYRQVIDKLRQLYFQEFGNSGVTALHKFLEARTQAEGAAPGSTAANEFASAAQTLDALLDTRDS